MESCSRKIHFCYGHRVFNHESKCASIHGHNGVVWIYATPYRGELDALGRVIDFSVLKNLVGTWIDTHWDHTTILWEKDVATIELLARAPRFKELFLLPTNPTAENLASYLLWEVCPKVLVGSGVVVYKVVFWETENCFATAEVDPADLKLQACYGHANVNANANAPRGASLT